MQIPSDKGKDRDNPPPGGRAFQRIQQDRKARGLDELPTPGTEDAKSTDKDAPNEAKPKREK
jgi:hypothetical protein